MKTLEVIHLRMSGDDQESLVNLVRAAVKDAAGSPDVRIYRHARIEGDFLVHLHREGDGQRDQVSELGLRLVSLLRFHGLVEHSVWVRTED